jgi:hypothetical protein
VAGRAQWAKLCLQSCQEVKPNQREMSRFEPSAALEWPVCGLFECTAK